MSDFCVCIRDVISEGPLSFCALMLFLSLVRVLCDRFCGSLMLWKFL